MRVQIAWVLIFGSVFVAACNLDEKASLLPAYSKEVVFKGLLIDKIYPSMDGPWRSTDKVDLGISPAKSKYLWITKYRAEVMNEDGTPGAQEFMCHSTMLTKGAPGVSGESKGETSLLSISQGQKEVVFPDGYALKVRNHPNRVVSLNGMVLNNNYDEINKKVDFKISFDFYDDSQAKMMKLRPLRKISAATLVPVEELSQQTRSASLVGDTPTCEASNPEHAFEDEDHVKKVQHWIVPPGEHVYNTEVTPQIDLKKDVRLHYIWMHVHPYARSMELRDATTGTSVWHGKVNNDPKLALIRSVEHFESTEGIPLYRDHSYRLVTVYNNTTNKNVDAMASLWMYITP